MSETLQLRTTLAWKYVRLYDLEHHLVDDLMQDTAVRVLAGARYNPTYKVTTWLGAMTKYAALNILKQERKRAVFEDSNSSDETETASPRSDPEQLAIVHDLLAYARRAAARDFALVATQAAGFSAKDVVQHVGGTPGAAHRRCSRARQHLRQLLSA